MVPRPEAQRHLSASAPHRAAVRGDDGARSVRAPPIRRPVRHGPHAPRRLRDAHLQVPESADAARAVGRVQERLRARTRYGAAHVQPQRHAPGVQLRGGSVRSKAVAGEAHESIPVVTILLPARQPGRCRAIGPLCVHQHVCLRLAGPARRLWDRIERAGRTRPLGTERGAERAAARRRGRALRARLLIPLGRVFEQTRVYYPLMSHVGLRRGSNRKKLSRM